MRQKKLKLSSTKDRGFTKWEWVELVGMIIVLLIFAALAMALFTALLKLMIEVAG